jgi:hypothetical protein
MFYIFSKEFYFAIFQDTVVIGASVAATSRKPGAVVLVSLTGGQILHNDSRTRVSLQCREIILKIFLIKTQ